MVNVPAWARIAGLMNPAAAQGVQPSGAGAPNEREIRQAGRWEMRTAARRMLRHHGRIGEAAAIGGLVIDDWLTPEEIGNRPRIEAPQPPPASPEYEAGVAYCVFAIRSFAATRAADMDAVTALHRVANLLQPDVGYMEGGKP